MTSPNMDAITASIERSLQNCSLNHNQRSSNNNDSAGIGSARFVAGRSSTSDSTENLDIPLQLNSEIRLPCYWEQCLDLKTGEVYYINWRTGMKSQEDPRTNQEVHVINGGVLSSEEEDESEGSSAEDSSSSTSRELSSSHYSPSPPPPPPPTHHPEVLVVAGCKTCFMYFMVPKQVEDCPKCFGQLLHFDRSQIASP